jgi:FkbM family methyltransferase
MEGGAVSATGAWGSAKPSLPTALALALCRNTRLGRGPSRKRMLRILRRLHPGPVDTHVWGAPVRLHPWTNVSERTALTRSDRNDPEEHKLLARTMAARRSVFVDIGANAGLYSLHAALSSAAGGRIYAIEPNRALLDRLAFNLDLARRAGRVAPDVAVTAVPVALSDYDGDGYLAAAKSEGWRQLGASGDPVPVQRLQTMLAEQGIKRIDLLKIDVEGHEDRVLLPFFSTAPRKLWPRTIIIEHTHSRQWRRDCIAECLALGYRRRAIEKNMILKYRGVKPQ